MYMEKETINRIIIPILLITFCFIVLKKCSFHTIPKNKLSAIHIDIDESYEDKKYQIIITNPVHCPMRFTLSCLDEEVNDLLHSGSPFLLAPRADTSIIINNKGNLKGKINIKVKWGDPSLAIPSSKLQGLPFPKDKSYQLLQGNNSSPTHNTKLSRYAFDFTMKIGDTITSTQDGYVVGVIDGYSGWGMSDKWKSYGNQILIYDTTSYLFTMYGHLKQDGSLVEIGDYVRIGKPIALSGKTGQTTEEHLHFNVFRSDYGKSGLRSYPLDSIGQYKVNELKRNQWLSN